MAFPMQPNLSSERASQVLSTGEASHVSRQIRLIPMSTLRALQFTIAVVIGPLLCGLAQAVNCKGDPNPMTCAAYQSKAETIQRLATSDRTKMGTGGNPIYRKWTNPIHIFSRRHSFRNGHWTPSTSAQHQTESASGKACRISAQLHRCAISISYSRHPHLRHVSM